MMKKKNEWIIDRLKQEVRDPEVLNSQRQW